MTRAYKRSSGILLKIAQAEHMEGNVTYQGLVNTLGERAFGIVIIFFALPSLLPFSVIPGVAFTFSLPIAFFALQMISQRKSLWLPHVVGRQKVSHQKISVILYTVIPYIVRLENFTKPRWMWMTSPLMEIINGIALLFVTILLMLPIPFSNFIFAGIIVFFGLGFIERDGIYVLIGYMCLCLYILFVGGLTLTAIHLFNNY